MLSSAGFPPGASNRVFTPKSPRIQIFPALKYQSISLSPNKIKPNFFSSYASSPTQEASVLDEKSEGKKKLGVVVKPMERPRLVLKFIWMEKNIGIAVDQVIPGGGGGTIPVSPYYFWPRIDAWEELKVLLESKQWISYKQVVVLLNQATEIINLWQQSGGGN